MPLVSSLVMGDINGSLALSLSSHKERFFAGYVQELSHSIVCVDFKVRVVVFCVFVFPVLSME